LDFKYEVTVVPVSDVDRAKEFYSERLGFVVDVDPRAGESFRVVQPTPPGSACSISGQTPGLHPERADYGTYLSFSDPDGNGWLVQEVRRGKS
jgi:catechol 2,3-dioxygenase-like lactoylglutathione lyase family enzyme